MQNLSLVAGLGNPGLEYAHTRNNAGYMVLERLARRWQRPWKQDERFKARVARATVRDNSVLLCQPLTFMNLSGEGIQPLAAYYRVPPNQLLVLVDDADLPLGTLRLRPGGSSGGHHGLESIEISLGTRDYARLRLGIGRWLTGERQIRDYVLSRFQPVEKELLEKVLERAANQVECWLTEGIAKAMNNFNGLIGNEGTKEN